MIDQLFNTPERFSFFQAVRLLERHSELSGGGASPLAPVGTGAAPSAEVVRFRVEPTLTFPGSEIARLQLAPTNRPNDKGQPTLSVTFMGLIGPHGALPDHYTLTLATRVREKDVAMRDFFDLFHHRTLSLFYRAWEKYRFAYAFERERRKGQENDTFTQTLNCLVGLGTAHLTGRTDSPDDTYLYYSGLFSGHSRSALALERMLTEHFGLPVKVQQFFGRWLALSEENRSKLPHATGTDALNNRLGEDVVLGSRVWDVATAFRLGVGPLTYDQFCRFMPIGDRLSPLAELTRRFVGMEFDFDVQLVLLGDEVPELQLGATGPRAPRLGWNTWLTSGTLECEATDAVFTPDV